MDRCWFEFYFIRLLQRWLHCWEKMGTYKSCVLQITSDWRIQRSLLTPIRVKFESVPIQLGGWWCGVVDLSRMDSRMVGTDHQHRISFTHTNASASKQNKHHMQIMNVNAYERDQRLHKQITLPHLSTCQLFLLVLIEWRKSLEEISIVNNPTSQQLVIPSASQ